MSWAEPATVSFDNVLVTSAATVQAAPGTSLLRESFEDPSRPLYGALSQAPDQYDFAYVGGILRARRLAENGTAIVLLPYNVDHDHATVAVTARLADQIEGRYLILGCRRHDVPRPDWLLDWRSPRYQARFTIVRWDSDVEVPLISWQESPAIQRDAEWNRLELTCTGSTIEASANGQVLGSVQDGTYPQGQSLMGVGVFAGQGAPAEAYFDDLEVTRR